LVLPHIYDEDYWNFYEGRRSEGDRIILDNGAYEGREFHEIRFTSLLRYLKPQVAVLPDYLLQPWEKTWHAAIAFLDRWAKEFPEVEWMYVPQAVEGDKTGWRTSMFKGAEEPRVSWIGISRAYATHIACRPLARVDEIESLTSFYKRKVHCLGMLAGNVHELHYLEKAGCISIDSSAPVWRGWCGYTISQEGWPDPSIDFNSELLKGGVDVDSIIFDNLEACNIDTSSAR
jgi:hypothetical protein